MRVIIISGRSGSGKSISLHLLEDMGFYVIDNMPAKLLDNLLEHIKNQYNKIAIGIDARNLPRDIDELKNVLDELKAHTKQCEIVYLDADDDTLIKRFSETRRKHPLSDTNTSLREAIKLETQLLDPLASLADFRVDTSHFTLHQLRDVISKRVVPHQQGMSIVIQSFGFKFGVPSDCDFVFDVRCLPNPYWQTELRPYTGQDAVIQEYLQSKKETHILLEDISGFLAKWIPHFSASNRTYMTIGIGCTGGQHRSVYIAEKLTQQLAQQDICLQLRHRELS